MQSRPIHTFKTRHTTDEVEARDTSVEPLVFRAEAEELEHVYQVGDNVTLFSKDGDLFIGRIDEVDEWAGTVSVELR